MINILIQKQVLEGDAEFEIYYYVYEVRYVTVTSIYEVIW